MYAGSVLLGEVEFALTAQISPVALPASASLAESGQGGKYVEIIIIKRAGVNRKTGEMLVLGDGVRAMGRNSQSSRCLAVIHQIYHGKNY